MSLKVSIITPSFNQAQFLPETLHSVREQTYPHIEHIVVDGGSTDGSVDILRSAPAIRWISEPDRGQVDALNKGLAMATGDILGWLCSDDTLSRNAVSIAIEALERTHSDLVYGNGEIVDVNGKFLKMAKVVPFDFNFLLYCKNWIPQPTVFFRRQLFHKAGPLREEFDNAFDYELWLRMSEYGTLTYVPEIHAQLRIHPLAKTTAHADISYQDCERIRAEYWGRSGLPRFLARNPWFLALHYYYRLKRLWIWYRLRHSRAHDTIAA